MIKMAAMPIYGINTKKSFQDQWAYFYKTWYEASETQAHYI